MTQNLRAFPIWNRPEGNKIECAGSGNKGGSSPDALQMLRLSCRKQRGRTERTIMHFLWTIILGLLVGVVAKLLMPGRDPGGFIITILLGIAGSLVAGWIGRAVGWYGPNDSAGFIASVGGAILLLLLYHLFQKAKTRQ